MTMVAVLGRGDPDAASKCYGSKRRSPELPKLAPSSEDMEYDEDINYIC